MWPLYEVRLPWLRRLRLRLRRIQFHDHFNEHLSRKLFVLARVLDLEG
jgi:hypothetical protein